MTRVLAGAGRAEIDLGRGVLPFDGFDEVLHQLHARALALDDGAVRVVVVVLELTSLPDWAVYGYRGLVARAAGTSLDNVVVAASHTFSAPHLPSAQGSGAAADAFRHAIDRAVVRASSSAVAALAPANVTFGRGQSRVNVCRDVLTPAGWWLGADDAGPTNDDLPVLRFERDDGATVALLAAYGVQSSVLDGSRTSAGRRLVSSDLFGAASRHVERTIGGDAVVLLLPGAAWYVAPVVAAVRQVPAPDGRISISDAGAAAHPLVELLGQRLGDQLGRAAAAAGLVDAAPIGIRRFRVEVPAQVLPARREALRPQVPPVRTGRDDDGARRGAPRRIRSPGRRETGAQRQVGAPAP